MQVSMVWIILQVQLAAIHAGSSAHGLVTPSADACSLYAWTLLMSHGSHMTAG